MRNDQSTSRSRDDGFDRPAEGCGVVLGVGALALLLLACMTLSVLLLASNPDRWEGTADASEHPVALLGDPRDPQTVYVGTEQGHVLVSRDAAQHWAVYHEGLPQDTPISALALSPAGQMFAGGAKGVYRSDDGGQMWQAASAGLPPTTQVDALVMLSDGVLLAGTVNTGVLVSRAASGAWTASVGLPPRADVYTLGRSSRGHVLAGLVNGGVYVSQDKGGTWTASNHGLDDPASLAVFSFLEVSRQGQTEPLLLAGTNRGVYTSQDGGVTWRLSSDGIGSTRVIGLASLSSGPQRMPQVIAGTDTGVFVSRDGGGAWRPLGVGLPPDQHVGAVLALRREGGEVVMLAAVDQLYQHPNQWLFATQPWRALGVVGVVLLLSAMTALLVWFMRTNHGAAPPESS